MSTSDRDQAAEECRRAANALATGRVEDAWAALDGLRGHMASCPACYARLVQLGQSVLSWGPQMLSLEAAGQLEEPEHYPRFDLAFLRPPEVWATPAKGRVRQLAEGVTLRARVLKRKARASFEGLPPWLSPAPAPAYAAAGPTRGEQRGARGQVLSLPDWETNVRVTLTMSATREGKGRLSVQVCELESGRPLESLHISLRGSAGRESTPARAGRASFGELDADQYILTIRMTEPGEANPEWRLPITLEAG